MTHAIADAPTPVRSATNAYAAASTKDQRTLDRVFQHPLSHGLEWRDVVGLLTRIGDVDEKHDGEVSLQAAGETFVMRPPHSKDMVADDVMALRHFLTGAGWAPDAPSLQTATHTTPSRGVIVAIDHNGARIFKIGGAHDDGTGNDGRHLLHHITHADDDRDGDQTFPADTRFFNQVAVAIGGQGEIVLISDGKGQSNEAHHLDSYLQTHDADMQTRIVASITADLKHLTPAEMVKLGRETLDAHAVGAAAAASDERVPA